MRAARSSFSLWSTSIRCKRRTPSTGSRGSSPECGASPFACPPLAALSASARQRCGSNESAAMRISRACSRRSYASMISCTWSRDSGIASSAGGSGLGGRSGRRSSMALCSTPSVDMAPRSSTTDHNLMVRPMSKWKQSPRIFSTNTPGPSRTSNARVSDRVASFSPLYASP